MTLPVAVLAGGLATRLRPMTEHVPKILLDVGGRPFAEHQIELLHRHGIREIVFCVGYLGELVERRLGNGSRWGMRFQYVFDGASPLGTGGALRQAQPSLESPFFVLYGDSYLECDYQAIASAFRASGQPGLMTVYRNEDRYDRSNVEFEDGRIVRYDKTTSTTAMRHIDYGLGILTTDALQPWAGMTNRFDLSEVYQRLISAGALAGYEVQERFYEIGSAEGLEELRAVLSTRTGKA